jgi:DNA repair exonuclease SbcCD ATPase subunit
LNESRTSHSQFLSKLSEVIPFNDEDTFVASVSELVVQSETLQRLTQTHKSLKASHSALIKPIRGIIQFQSEAEIPQLVAELHSRSVEFANFKQHHESILAEIQRWVNCPSFDHLPGVVKSITQVLSESQQMVKCSSFGDLPNHVRSLVQTVSEAQQIIEADDFTEIPATLQSNISAIQELKDQLAAASDLLNRVLSRVFKRRNSISFPLEAGVAQKLTKAFDEFAARIESLQGDVDSLCSSAKALGFVGTSCVEAADFLAEELCKKRSQEHLETMVTQMKQLREDKERERQASEQRNQANLQKLKELRRSKAQLIEQSSAKQTELYDAIEGLQRDVRDLEGKVDQLTKVKEELIRLCANDVCDRNVLKTGLSSAERIRLKL